MAVREEALQGLRTLAELKTTKLKEILSIAQKQKEMIEQDDADALRESMERRAALAGEIDRLDGQYNGFKRELRAMAGGGGAAFCGMEAGMKQTLIQIQNEDRANEQGLCEKIGEYQKSIRQLRLSSKGRELYAQAYDRNDGIFFDIKK